MKEGLYFDTRQIVTIAVLSSLGGALSTFVGYLGNLVNLSLGVPFGAGQFMAGLHVLWLVLMRVLVPKRGVGLFGGTLKGLVELFTGSTHGIVIVMVSLVQGLLIDLGAEVGGNPRSASVSSRVIWWLIAGISAGSNVLVFQAIYFSGAPWYYIALITVLGFCSGVIFAGYFAWETVEFLHDAGMMTDLQSTRPAGPTRNRRFVRNIPAVLLVLFLTVGSVYYVVAVARTFVDPYSCDVVGLVENPYTYSSSSFADDLVTIEAELIGAYTHLDPANYTGVLLSTILIQASPEPEATKLSVRARDGYTVVFDLDAVMTDSRMLLTDGEDGLWLIAGDYDGSLWVRMVTVLEVY